MTRTGVISALALAVTATLCCALAARRAGAEAEILADSVGIIIIRSGDEAPYTAAQRAALERLSGHRGAVSAHSISDAPDPASIDPSTVVIAIGSEAAARYDADLPRGAHLVYCMTADPAAVNLHAGGRAFGVAMEPPVVDQLELMRAAVPGARRIGVLHRSSSAYSRRAMEALAADLPADWTLEAVDADDHPSVSRAIEALMSRRIDFVWTVADPAVFDPTTVRALLLESLRRRVPVYGFSLAFVRAGALIGVGIDPAEHGAQAADLALSIAVARESGQPLPINRIRSPRVQLAINLVVAEQLGVRPPPSLLRRANHVFRAE